MRYGRLSMDPPVKPEDDTVKFLIGMTIFAAFTAGLMALRLG